MTRILIPCDFANGCGKGSFGLFSIYKFTHSFIITKKKTMANYYASARSNYFKVKNMDAFKQETLKMNLSIHAKDGGSLEDGGLVCLLSGCEGGWPHQLFNEEIDDFVDFDWVDFFKRHLADENVAIVMESGNENLRYIVGVSTAYTWTGETLQVSLDDIYRDVIEEFGGDVKMTEAVY